MIIAIDGPAGAGKSTVAREVARALGLAYLDTGAMYRAVTLAALERGIDPADGEACGRLARELSLTFDEDGRIRIDGRPGEPDIRSAEVSRSVSAVSAHPAVRRAVVSAQRALAARQSLVAEGRDTTTVVFPLADHKFFLTASESERARRRARELGEEHRLGAVREEIERRDRLDSTRAYSPLTRAPDAELVETDGLGVAEVVERILELVRGRDQP
jgi:cytidylate kinase